mgnify:CR=1 FL=1
MQLPVKLVLVKVANGLILISPLPDVDFKSLSSKQVFSCDRMESVLKLTTVLNENRS